MRRIPSFPALRAFEAAARLGSFARASEELHLTPSAVSHQIRALERTLGRALFRRANRQATLTADGERLRCLVPAPKGYRNPFPWPASRDVAWFANVPHKELTVEKAVQNWIRVDGDKLRFPGGGTMFPNGADAYIDDIGKIVPLHDGSIRTALDTGCGVISRHSRSTR